MKNSRAAPRPVVLPAWEMCAYLFLTIGSHFYSFYEAYQVSQSKSVMLMHPLL